MKNLMIFLLLVFMLVIPVFGDTCILTNNQDQTINAGGDYTNLTSLNTESVDTNNMHDSTNSYITIKTSGYYVINSVIRTNQVNVYACLYRNSERLDEVFFSAATDLTTVRYLNASDRIMVKVFGSSSFLLYGLSYSPILSVSTIDNQTISGGSNSEMSITQEVFLILITFFVALIAVIKLWHFLEGDEE